MTAQDTEQGRREHAEILLLDMLLVAVSMSLHRMRDWSDRECASIGRELADTIAAHSDDLMYGGKHCAETFNALADALAVGARAPGGVFFRGLHWCVGSGHYGIEAEQPCQAEIDREAA